MCSARPPSLSLIYSQSGLPEVPMNPSAREAQEDIVSQRSNVLSSTAQPLPHMPQSGLPQVPMNPPAHGAQDNVVSQRSNSNVLSSILIGSGVPSKCDPVRSVYMNIPRSILKQAVGTRRNTKGVNHLFHCQAQAVQALSKRHNLLQSYPFLPTSSETSTERT
jgi:hypothetical protein